MPSADGVRWNGGPSSAPAGAVFFWTTCLAMPGQSDAI